MDPDKICTHCLLDDHPVDVKGHKFLDDGTQITYQICTSCCTQIRYHNYHREPEKIKEFWSIVWENLNLDVVTA